MNDMEQHFYSAGWAARKAFEPRARANFGRTPLRKEALTMWLKGYDACEAHWRTRG